MTDQSKVEHDQAYSKVEHDQPYSKVEHDQAHAKVVRPHLGGEVRHSVLPSGLRVVSERVEGSHTFSVGFFVRVGSRHEPVELHGVSHFLEHVLFKGTDRRSAEQISATIEQVGGDINAYTAREHTCFYAKVLSDDAAVAVDVITDMLTRSLVLADDVEAEREVILDEIDMHADDSAELASELALRRLFGEHPLGRPVIGSPGSINALTRDQIVGFWRSHYHPEHMVVAASGDVDHDRLVAGLAAFTRPGDAREPLTLPAGSGTATTGLAFQHRDADHCTAVLAFPGPAVFDDRRYPLGVLMTALGGGMSSRLFLDIRERRGLTYSIDATEGAWSDAGLLTVEWGCSPVRLAEILGRVRACIADVAEHGITADELARVKGQLRGQTVLTYESPGARMSRLGSATVAGDTRTMDEILDHYDRVTLSDVHQVANEFLTVDPVLAVVGPRVDEAALNAVLDHWSTEVR